MKDKNGFTLVELLAVIVVLGILLTLVTMSVIRVINDSKTKVGDFTEKQIKDAALTFALDHPDCDDVKSICTNDSGEYTYTFNGKGYILNYFTPYFAEMQEKCTINENAKIVITSNDNDIKVDEISGITCEG